MLAASGEFWRFFAPSCNTAATPEVPQPHASPFVAARGGGEAPEKTGD